MKSLIILPLFAIAALVGAGSEAASAKPGGCLKGAAVGGVAGHYAGHHGVLGAIAGCAYGSHKRNQYNRSQEQMQPNQPRT